MFKKAVIEIDSRRAREVLAEVPGEFRDIVAISGAIVAQSDTYACPFCEQRVLLIEEAEHRKECAKTFARP